MVKRFLLIFLLLTGNCIALLAQTENTFNRKGLFRTTLTFATGFMPKNNINNLYLTGNIEYYPSTDVSLRGDGYYFFNSMNQDKTLKQNHSIFYGGAYHFGKGQLDPFLGLQAGLAYSQCGIVPQGTASRASAFNPLFSPLAGFNYYAVRWFHLFINLRYIRGNHLADDAVLSLNEWNVSFGLGFNLQKLKNR